MKKITAYVLLIIICLAGWVGYDVYQNEQIERVMAQPEQKPHRKPNQVLFDLENDNPVNLATLDGTFEYANGRYDTADFQLQPLMRIVYSHWDKVDAQYQEKIKETFLDFKYWMDQPGTDAMCYWSENHQLLFATSEFLAGQRWPDSVFSNTGKTGSQHKEMARQRIMTWLEQRWLYGFTEWYSNVYYVEDIAPLANLIEFSQDAEMVQQAKIILDLLLNDVATQSYKGTFITTSGRLYHRSKVHGKGNSMRTVIEHIWGENRWGYNHPDRKGMDLNFIYLKNYQVPKVIKAIGEDETSVVIKATNGLNMSELEGEGLLGLEDPQIMMQWAMESFINPEVVENSVDYISANNMFPNEFLHDIKMLNITSLRVSGLLPTVSRVLNPVANGASIQRANTYTYRTPDYLLATAQSYHPGSYGDQHHIWNATIADDLSIFTTHPARSLSETGALSGSPGYWVGGGRLPHAAQDKNIVMNIFKIPKKPGFMESVLVDYTHAHFPKKHMDEHLIDGRYAFGRKGDTYFAFTARNPLNFHTGEWRDHDLIQPGKDSYWIFELSTATSEGSFADFIARIKSNPVSYEDNRLSYKSNNQLLELNYQSDFKVNGQVVNTEHARFDSPYAKVERKAHTMTIEHNGKALFLDFYNGIREER
jgi:hypothetical protein